jgi:hypothetical protein
VNNALNTEDSHRKRCHNTRGKFNASKKWVVSESVTQWHGMRQMAKESTFMVKYDEHYEPIYSIHGWLPIPGYKVELERLLDDFSAYSNN